MSNKASRARLSTRIVDGKIVIEIGAKTLSHAYRVRAESENEGVRVRFRDCMAFVEEVVRQLEREEEDGTTLVHEMLDAATDRAVENGAEGVEVRDV